MIHPHSIPRALRIAILLFAILATLGVSSASVSPAHIHANAPGSSCDICFTAHAVTWQINSAIAFPAAPGEHSTSFVPAVALAGYQPFLTEDALTRGPPADRCSVAF